MQSKFESFISKMIILREAGYNSNSHYKTVDIFLNQNYPDMQLFATEKNYIDSWHYFQKYQKDLQLV